MGVRILTDIDTGAVLYDSVTMYAFGPVFEDFDDCQAFLDLKFSGNADPRILTDSELRTKYDEYVDSKLKCSSCGIIGLKETGNLLTGNDPKLTLPDSWEWDNPETCTDAICSECAELKSA